MNNTTNNSKTNHTEIGNNINRSSQLNANNDQDINLKSHSIYRRFLPGLLMLLLGVVILSAPVAANAQITYYTLPNGVYVDKFDAEILVADCPEIYAYPGWYVGYRPVLYKQNPWGNWEPKQYGAFQRGMVDNSSRWRSGQPIAFNMIPLLSGKFKLAYELYYYDGARWVLQVNQYALGIDAFAQNIYGVTYNGFFEELIYPIYYNL
jgi:hypothetical protein